MRDMMGLLTKSVSSNEISETAGSKPGKLNMNKIELGFREQEQLIEWAMGDYPPRIHHKMISDYEASVGVSGEELTPLGLVQNQVEELLEQPKLYTSDNLNGGEKGSENLTQSTEMVEVGGLELCCGGKANQ